MHLSKSQFCCHWYLDRYSSPLTGWFSLVTFNMSDSIGLLVIAPEADGEPTYLHVIQPVLTLLPQVLVLLINIRVLEHGLEKLSAIGSSTYCRYRLSNLRACCLMMGDNDIIYTNTRIIIRTILR